MHEIKLQQFEMDKYSSRTDILFVLILDVYSEHVVSVNNVLSYLNLSQSQLYSLFESEKTIKRRC